jgi:hypothetical protein
LAHHGAKSSGFMSTLAAKASSETVRLFSNFKKKQLLQIKGSTLIIKNKAGLENVLAS